MLPAAGIQTLHRYPDGRYALGSRSLRRGRSSCGELHQRYRCRPLSCTTPSLTRMGAPTLTRAARVADADLDLHRFGVPGIAFGCCGGRGRPGCLPAIPGERPFHQLRRRAGGGGFLRPSQPGAPNPSIVFHPSRVPAWRRRGCPCSRPYLSMHLAYCLAALVAHCTICAGGSSLTARPICLSPATGPSQCRRRVTTRRNQVGALAHFGRYRSKPNWPP